MLKLIMFILRDAVLVMKLVLHLHAIPAGCVSGYFIMSVPGRWVCVKFCYFIFLLKALKRISSDYYMVICPCWS